MNRKLLAALALFPVLAAAQGVLPFIIGRQEALLAPAVDGAGSAVVFGASVTPDGATQNVMDLWVAAADGSGLRRLTRLSGDGRLPPQGAMAVSVSANGARAAFHTLLPSQGRNAEEVRVLDLASGTNRTVAVDTAGCIQPLVAGCPNCFFTCVHAPHISSDGSRVLYSARRQNPFYVVNADGTGLAQLAVYQGALAPAPQRVISRGGLAVFTSSAPFGPTFAPSATDVYVMNLDGTNIRAVTRFGNDASIQASNATISADGSTVAFEANYDAENSRASQVRHIWTIRADGSGLRALAPSSEPASQPSLSGDGTLVAFTRLGQIHLVRADGGGLRALTNFQQSAARDPVITEDGARVAFAIGPKNGGRGAIYSVRADGSGLRAVYAPRALIQNGIAGAVAGSAPSPGSLLSAYGLNLAPDGIAAAGRFPLPDLLAGVSLLVNGRASPLLAVTPWQVNAQLPPDLAEGPAAFQFRFSDGALAAAGAAEVKAYSPAVYVLPSGVTAQAAVFHAGTGVACDRANPARAGEAVEVYATGLGGTQPFVPAGMPAPASPPATTLAIPLVTIGGQPARVIFSGLAPGLAGVYQVNVIIPSGLRTGPHVVNIRIGTETPFGFASIFVQ